MEIVSILASINYGMVIGSDIEIRVRLLVGPLSRRKSIGEFRFRFDSVFERPFFQPENTEHIHQ
jgi:hypothetical protein